VAEEPEVSAIPREPAVGWLEEDEVERVTEAVFMPHAPRPADVLLVFGTVQADWDGLAESILREEYRTVVLAGRLGPTWYDQGEPIAAAMMHKLIRRGVDPERITLQCDSMNTLEDVEMSLAWLEGATSVTFAAKAHHSGRCQRTLRRFLPTASLAAHVQVAFYGDVAVMADRWHLSEIGRGRVMGEYRRIMAYSERGDIAVDP